jgi:two-component system phosphate regulon response regulator PhoB
LGPADIRFDPMTQSLVLIADDDPVARRVLTAALHHEGYKTIASVDAMQTVMMAHRSHPVAIVLDFMMPGGNGLDVIKRLRTSTETAEIPVIVISASTDPSLPARAAEAGAEAFLPKPVDLTELAAHLRRLIPE